MSLAPGRFRRRSCAAALVVLGALLLAACGPDPTPLPVVPVETAPAAEQTASPAADVLSIDALTYAMLTDEERAALERAAEVRVVEAITADTAAPALSVASFAGAQESTYNLPVAARLNVSAPLDNPAVAQAVTGFLMGETGRDVLRLALANAGYPDGLVLTYTGSPAIAARSVVMSGDRPIRWLLADDSSNANVEVGAGAGAAALLESGGVQLGALPLHLTAGWRLYVDDAGLPVLERETSD